MFFPPDFPRFLCSQHRHPGRAALTYACGPGGVTVVCSGHCVHFPYGCTFPLTRAEVRPKTDQVQGCEGVLGPPLPSGTSCFLPGHFPNQTPAHVPAWWVPGKRGCASRGSETSPSHSRLRSQRAPHRLTCKRHSCAESARAVLSQPERQRERTGSRRPLLHGEEAGTRPTLSKRKPRSGPRGHKWQTVKPSAYPSAHAGAPQAPGPGRTGPLAQDQKTRN